MPFQPASAAATSPGQVPRLPPGRLAVRSSGPSPGSTLTVPTGYAGNDVVEPSVLFDASAPFLGYPYVLCCGGYFTSDALYENPNLWVSSDGNTWVYVVFTGGTGVATPGYGGVLTPVIASGAQGDGLISDPFLAQAPDGSFVLLWNQFLNPTGSGGTGTGSNNWGIKAATATTLAGPWTTPVSVLQTVLATTRPACPSAFWDGARWQVYAIDLANTSATTVLRYTAAALTGPWAAQTNPSLPLPAGYTGQVWWHLNAYGWLGSHLLLMQDTAAGTSGGGNVWLLASDDGGTTWTLPAAPFAPSAGLYRSAGVLRSVDGAQFVLDCFYGNLSGGHWYLSRATVSSPVLL